MRRYQNPLVNETENYEVLWIYFDLYGIHEAGVKICDRALHQGVAEARKYANKIWERSEKNDLGRI